MDSDAIIDAVTSVTKKWAKQRKAEERQASARCRRSYAMTSRDRVTLKEAAWDVMEEAYLKASNNGTLPAHARQIMYAARPEILSQTGEKSLDSAYFTQTLLPDYMNSHQETTEWRVVFDARGNFSEPHTEKRIPLGTINVDAYLGSVTHYEQPLGLIWSSDEWSEFPTRGPADRFGAILFIEKEGFMPLFDAVQLAERYDIAIMSTKGMSVTASRRLVDHLCGVHDIPLLVLHDFDQAGLSILGSLQRDNRRYVYRHRIKVIDLGVRLADVEEHDLESEAVHYRSPPARNLRKNAATDEEIDFLCGGPWKRSGHRVELNAFTSDQLVKWIEAKLEQHGIRKVVPDNETLASAYRRAVEVVHLRKAIADATTKAKQISAKSDIPANLREQVETELAEEPATPWDQAVIDIVDGGAT